MYFNIFETRNKIKKPGLLQCLHTNAFYMCPILCKLVFQLEMLPVAIVLAIPGSHDDAYCARPEFIIALYYEAKIFCVCK